MGKDNKYLKYLGLTTILVLMIFCYSVGRVQGQLEMGVGMASWFNSYENKLNNQTNTIYVNKSCDGEVLNNTLEYERIIKQLEIRTAICEYRLYEIYNASWSTFN